MHKLWCKSEKKDKLLPKLRRGHEGGKLMAEYIELIDKYRIVQSKDADYNPPSLDWVDNTGEIVRCKACKHSTTWCSDKSTCFLWDEDGIDVFNDGFCNFGKKREGSR